MNRRIKAKEAKRLGLVQAVVDEPDLDDVIAGWEAEISDKSAATILSTRRLIWDEARVGRIEAGLAAEKREFLRLIGKPETRAGMQRFLGLAS